MTPKFLALQRALSRRDTLDARELDLIEALPFTTRSFGKGEEIIAEHSQPNSSCLLIEGFAARTVVLTDGGRQITSLQVPGDFVDLHAFVLKIMDHSVVALCPCTAAFVPHAAILAAVDASPHLGRLFWLSTVIDGAIHRAWLVSSGRRSALGRLGHLLCELFLRLQIIGRTDGSSFALPLTQVELGDVLGLSTVHVNRTVQQLRKNGLVTWLGQTVTIEDFARLAKVADFDPAYLNLVAMPR